MAFVFTYNALVNQLRNYCERDDTDFIDTIPVFVTLSIDRISKDAKLLGAEKYIVGTFIPNEEVLQKPALWRQTMTFNVGNGENNNVRNTIPLRSYEFCTNYNPDRSTTGFPEYYADYGFNNWLVVPTPDQNYPFEICYIETFGPLDPENQTNWLTQNAPQLLLYATLTEAMLFLKNDERASFWEDKYMKALASLSDEDKGRITDRSTDREKD